MKRVVFSGFAIAVLFYMAGCATKSTGPVTKEPMEEETAKVEIKEAPEVEEEMVLHFDFPKDYKNWTHGTSRIILDKASPLYGFQQVFVNDTAVEAYKSGGGYPEGSMLIIGFYEAITEGEEIEQGNIIWYAGMKKDARATQTGGWIFDGFDGKTFQSTIDDPVNGCYVCHTAKKDRDYVFTHFTGKISSLQGTSAEVAPGRFAFPADVRSWHHSNSKVILDKNSPLYGFQQIYVNDTGVESNKSAGTYPDGSIVTVGFYEPVQEGDAISQGDIIWYASMKKDSTVAGETGGWIFDGFDGKTLQSTIADPVTGCFSCHTTKKENDYIFSKYAP